MKTKERAGVQGQKSYESGEGQRKRLLAAPEGHIVLVNIELTKNSYI